MQITITDADGFISPDPDSSSDDPYYMVEYKFGVLDQSEYFDHQEALDYGDDGVCLGTHGLCVVLGHGALCSVVWRGAGSCGVA